MNDNLIMELWDTFKEYIPDKNKETAANQYVDFLMNNDVESSTLESLLGYDSFLDDAIKHVIKTEDYQDEDYDDYLEEDEDY